jgi:hypothetical protein
VNPLRALAVLALVASVAGCMREVLREEPGPTPVPVPAARGFHLGSAGLARLAVVECLDKTDRNAGMPAAEALTSALREAGVDVRGAILGRPGAVLAPSWLRSQARSAGVDGFATAAVSAFGIQESRRRAYVAMTAVILDPDGRIQWSRRVAAEQSLGDRQAALANGGFFGNNGGALNIAARIAAKEFADDLAVVPSQ